MRWSTEASRLDAILSQSGASGRFIINTRTKGNAVSQEGCVNRPEGSNWGDFGPHDQIGKMNLLTPERRWVAASEVKGGAPSCSVCRSTIPEATPCSNNAVTDIITIFASRMSAASSMMSSPMTRWCGAATWTRRVPVYSKT